MALGAPRLLKSRSLLRVKTLVETVPKRYTFSTFLLNRLGDPTRKQKMRKSRIFSINLRFGRPNSSKTSVFYDDFGSLGLSVALGAPRLLTSRSLLRVKFLVKTVPKRHTFSTFLLNLWEPLWASNLWKPLGISESVWELLGASESLWEFL